MTTNCDQQGSRAPLARQLYDEAPPLCSPCTGYYQLRGGGRGGATFVLLKLMGPPMDPQPARRRSREEEETPWGSFAPSTTQSLPLPPWPPMNPRALSWVAYNSCRASSPQVLMDFLCLESFCGLFDIGLIILSNFKSYGRSLKRQMKCWFKIFL